MLPFLSLYVSAAVLPVILSSRDSITLPFLIKGSTSMNGMSSFPSQQSTSRMIRPCETSTKRLVKYPESAVLSAVSERPFLAPCAEMKYSKTSRPSRKLDLIGSSIDLPDVSAIKPRIPASCLI